GPWKRYACAGPSASAAARRRLASSCSGKVSNAIPDDSRQFGCRARAVELPDSLGEPFREFLVRAPDGGLELDALALDAIRAAAAPRGVLCIEHDEERPVGEQAACRLHVELENVVDAEAAPDALVRERRVDVAVADDVRAFVERGPDHLVDELCTRRREQRRLRPRRDLAVVCEEQRSHALAELRPARLAGCDHAATLAAERLGQQLCLRRLAAAVDPLERDEHCAGGYGRPPANELGPWTRTSRLSTRPAGAPRRS